jgi:hypothetical protein
MLGGRYTLGTLEEEEETVERVVSRAAIQGPYDAALNEKRPTAKRHRKRLRVTRVLQECYKSVTRVL